MPERILMSCEMNGTIVDRLGQYGAVCIDSMTVIYFLEENERYLSVVRDLFSMVDQGRLFAFSSYLTLLEVLVKPLKDGRSDVVDEYKAILCQARGFRLLPINGEIAEEGARIRAQYGFRVPDALQLATALCHTADAFVTNDRRLRQFDELDVVLLEEYAA
ncbi:MAG: motility twitching protein PilT [Pirellulaceae bacterium]|nr:MAG: motility twitching protein PilT [Pirellulaceae bacterium]